MAEAQRADAVGPVDEGFRDLVAVRQVGASGLVGEAAVEQGEHLGQLLRALRGGEAAVERRGEFGQRPVRDAGDDRLPELRLQALAAPVVRQAVLVEERS